MQSSGICGRKRKAESLKGKISATEVPKKKSQKRQRKRFSINVRCFLFTVTKLQGDLSR